MDHQPHSRFSGDSLHDRGHGRGVVAIASDIKSHCLLRPGRADVRDRVSDDVRLIPGRDENRKPPAQLGLLQGSAVKSWGCRAPAGLEP